eukprot:9184295-Alexandrium_andersonii.AAC.1
MAPLPEPLDMSGEELDQLLTDVDALVGLNPVLRQMSPASTGLRSGDRRSLLPRAQQLPDSRGTAIKRHECGD